jgi:hypothetical protein
MYIKKYALTAASKLGIIQVCMRIISKNIIRIFISKDYI